MYAVERLILDFLLNFTTAGELNAFLSDPRNAALIVGGLVALSTAILGVFLLLRKLAMTTDAISHTVLFGIVVAFLVLLALGQTPDLSSPLLLIGAALAGVGTVVLTEMIQRSRLVKADAALGLVFPFLFALAVILVTRYIPNVHLDADAVMVGEIGVAWADTHSHCYSNCDDVIITPDDPRAEVARRCINCAAEGISPRDPRAQFEEICGNCGTYSAGEAWQKRLIAQPPELVFFPRAIVPLLGIAIFNLLFVGVFYKELKLGTFDSSLAAAFGFHPGALNYALMIAVSLTAVAAFNAVGAILVVAFFVIPAAAAYLLTDRLWQMFLIAPLVSLASIPLGYEVARALNLSISASMVMILFALFVLVWVFSPRYGVIAGQIKRRRQRIDFADQMVLNHLYNHRGTARESDECARATLHDHLNWSAGKSAQHLGRLVARNFVRVEGELLQLTVQGEAQVQQFRKSVGL